jgi:hypothetical protein
VWVYSWRTPVWPVSTMFSFDRISETSPPSNYSYVTFTRAFDGRHNAVLKRSNDFIPSENWTTKYYGRIWALRTRFVDTPRSGWMFYEKFTICLPSRNCLEFLYETGVSRKCRVDRVLVWILDVNSYEQAAAGAAPCPGRPEDISYVPIT